MATGVVAERGEEFSFIVCDLCQDVLDDPCVLPCWHVFCLTCLSAYTDHRTNSVVCPACQQTFSLPEDSLAGLRNTSHDFLTRVAKESSVIRREEESSYLRHYCRDREFSMPSSDQWIASVNRRCEECEDFLCHRCTCHHLLESHTAAKSATCQFHGKSREMFCETCDVEICGSCADDVHRRHEVRDLATYAQACREDLAAKREHVKKYDPESAAEEYIETIRQMIRVQTARQLHDVTVQVARRRRFLENQVDKMAADVRRDIEAKKRDYMSARGGFQTSRRDTLDLFEHLIDCGTEREIVELYPEIIRYLAEAMPEMTSKDDSQRKIVFIPAKVSGLSGHGLVGTLEGTGAMVMGSHSNLSVTSSMTTSADETSSTTTSAGNASFSERRREKTRHKWRRAVAKLSTTKGVKSPETYDEKQEKSPDRRERKGKMWVSLVNKVKHSQSNTQRQRDTRSAEDSQRKRRVQRKISVDETAKQESYGPNSTTNHHRSVLPTFGEEQEEEVSYADKGESSEICKERWEGEKDHTKALAVKSRDGDNAGQEMEATKPEKTARLGRDRHKPKSKWKWSHRSFDALEEKSLPDKNRRRSVSEKWLGLMSEDMRGDMERLGRDKEVARARLRRMWSEHAEENGGNQPVTEVHAGISEEEGDSTVEESVSSNWLKHRIPNYGVEDQNCRDRNDPCGGSGTASPEAYLGDDDEGVTLTDRLKNVLNISFFGLSASESSSKERQENQTPGDVMTPEQATVVARGNGLSTEGDVKRKSSIASILSTSSNLSHVTTSSLTSSDPEDGSKRKSYQGVKKLRAVLQRKRTTESQRTERSWRHSPGDLVQAVSDSDWNTDDTGGREGRNRSLGKKMKQLLKKK